MQTKKSSLSSLPRGKVHLHLDSSAIWLFFIIAAAFMLCTLLPPIVEDLIPEYFPIGTHYRDNREFFDNSFILEALKPIKLFVARNATLGQSTMRFEPPISKIKTQRYLTERYFLAIGISTVARLDGNDYKNYINQSLASLTSMLSQYYIIPTSRHRKRILVYIQDNTIHENPPFDNLEPISSPDYDVVLFKNKMKFKDPFEDVPGLNYTSSHNIFPGHLARQQNADVVSMTRHILHNYQFDHFMFMEDDFITCDDMVKETLRVMDELIHRDPSYCALRIAYGMNGIILPRKNLEDFTYFVECNIDMLPIDVLINWYQHHPEELMGPNDQPLPFLSCKQANKRSYFYKHILQEHIGLISSFSERNKEGFRPGFPQCGATSPLVVEDSEKHIDCTSWSIIPCSLREPAF
jgi:hypothetical protein